MRVQFVEFRGRGNDFFGDDIGINGFIHAVPFDQKDGRSAGIILVRGILIGWTYYLHIVGDVVIWDFKNDQIEAFRGKRTMGTADQIPQIGVVNERFVVLQKGDEIFIGTDNSVNIRSTFFFIAKVTRTRKKRRMFIFSDIHWLTRGGLLEVCDQIPVLILDKPFQRQVLEN